MADTIRNDIDRTVKKARALIEQLQRREETIGEQDTKAALIDPILTALGWDVHDLAEVRREYKRKPSDNPVDYAFFLDEKPLLFLEAKALRKDVTERKWITQTLSYATVVGVKWCVLTNGDDYRLYNSHAPVEVDEKLLWHVRVSNELAERETIQALSLLSRERIQGGMLTALWKTHFVDRRVKNALVDIFASSDSSLVRLIKKRESDLTAGQIKESLSRVEVAIEVNPADPQEIKLERVPAPPKTAPDKIEKIATRRVARDAVTLLDLIQAKRLRAPLELERVYKGHLLKAKVHLDGSVEFAGRRFNSLSLAGGTARATIIGQPRPNKAYPSTNGWTFWKYRDPSSDQLRPVDDLRQQYLADHRRNLAVI